MSKSKVLVFNGPSLNLLGMRQSHLDGAAPLAGVERRRAAAATGLGIEIEFRQPGAEHQLIDWLHEARTRIDGAVIDPAAHAHCSAVLADALAAIDEPAIEVRRSNVHRREAFRHHSTVAAAARGMVRGRGTRGYGFARQRLATRFEAAAR